MVALFWVPACGGSSSGTTNGDDIASYRQSVVDVQSAATQYRAAMLSDQMTTVAACQQVHDRYDAEVRTPVLNMGAMSGDLDSFMGQHGGAGMADMSCAAAGMSSELDQHDAVACRLADVSADQAEVVRHVGVMMSYAAHLSDRSDQMMGAVGGGMGTWGPMMSGCAGWHGSMMMMHR
jgi:hypothetical protein